MLRYNRDEGKVSAYKRADLESVQGKCDSISVVTNFVAFHFMKLKNFTAV